MGIINNQIVTTYYNLYRENEIVFTKEILRSLKLDPRQIYIKCNGSQWPCIINSCSLQMVKIIIGTSGGAYKIVSKKQVPPVSIRFGFLQEDNQSLAFFVNGKVSTIEPYMRSSELAVVTINFSQIPPDDLIIKIGTLISAKESFIHRKEERITLTESVQKKIALEKRESTISIESKNFRCILWDISFSGAQVIFQGDESFSGKDALLKLNFIEPQETIEVFATIVKVTPIENKKGLASLSLKFNEETVPLAYKLRINDYLTYNRKHFLDRETEEQKQTDGNTKEQKEDSSSELSKTQIQEQQNSNNTN